MFRCFSIRRLRRRCPSRVIVGLGLMGVLGSTGITSAAQAPAAGAQPGVDVLAEAKTLFDALDYERAVPLLDEAIVSLTAGATTPAVKARLASALEMRARGRFGMGDSDGARQDFTQLLTLVP